MEKFYKKETFKTRGEWLNARGFGGSSASAILGMNPYKSKLELYNDFLNEKLKTDDTSTPIMQYGHDSEPLIRKQFALDFAHKYKVYAPRQNEMYRRIDKPYLTASLDGRLLEIETGRKGILEIKTHDVKNKADLENWDSRLPNNYYIQIIHYLMVMKDYEFVVLVGKLRFYDYFAKEGKKLLKTEIRYYYIERNEVLKDIEILEKNETNFYENNILKKQPPKLEIHF